MYSYRGLSKEEYEDDYNEKIIYCNIHNVSGIAVSYTNLRANET